MKKVLSAIAVVLCGAFLCMPVSAATTSDPYKVYSNAIEKYNAASSVEMKITINAEVTDLIDPFKTVATVKQVRTADDKVEMEMSTVQDDKTLKSYYKNGYLYEETSYGSKIKTKVSAENALLESYNLSFDFPKLMMKDATIEAVEGGQKIKFTVSGNDMTKLLQDSFNDGNSSVKIKISDVGNAITVDDNGNLKNVKQWFNITMSDDDLILKMKYSSVITITSLNKIDKISFPNLNDYQ